MPRVLTPSWSRPRAHQKRRYSARPFYWTLLAFTGLAVLRWAIGGWEESPPRLITRNWQGVGPNAQILGRSNELEV